jgi:hypothetical protein
MGFKDVFCAVQWLILARVFYDCVDAQVTEPIASEAGECVGGGSHDVGVMVTNGTIAAPSRRLVFFGYQLIARWSPQ